MKSDNSLFDKLLLFSQSISEIYVAKSIVFSLPLLSALTFVTVVASLDLHF